MALILFRTWSLSLVMLVGCGVPGPSTKEPLAEAVSRPSPSPEEMTHRFYYWREEAMELHEMAWRREREADVLSHNKKGARLKNSSPACGYLRSNFMSPPSMRISRPRKPSATFGRQ